MGLVLTIVGLVLLFAAAPWPLDLKAHAVLHGLCAQTPSHSFVLGEHRLPFDARMTGIYGGFVASFCLLLGQRRHRAAGRPSWLALVLLGGGVAAMAFDGSNSFLRDLGHAHPYEPRNELRLATGLATGIALATIMCYLLAITLWRQPERTVPVVQGGRGVGWLWLAQLPFATLVLSGWSAAFVPVVVILMSGAALAIATLTLVVIVLFQGRDLTFHHEYELASAATIALALGVAVILLLAGARFLAERWFGIATLT